MSAYLISGTLPTLGLQIFKLSLNGLRTLTKPMKTRWQSYKDNKVSVCTLGMLFLSFLIVWTSEHLNINFTLCFSFESLFTKISFIFYLARWIDFPFEGKKSFSHESSSSFKASSSSFLGNNRAYKTTAPAEAKYSTMCQLKAK